MTKGDLQAPYISKPFDQASLDNHPASFQDQDMTDPTADTINIMKNKKKRKKKAKIESSDSEESEKSLILPYDGDFQDFTNTSEPYMMLYKGTTESGVQQSNLASLHLDKMIPGLTQKLYAQNSKIINLQTD